ncbi:MAG TPA: 50S ribosomal protein L23 [Thermoanaerobaculia bacterium]|nr:50S ribosomal protein L23 [Thermoanaerobaculia bacterium]HUM30640.1 50S ribosomal protein L23 [Thermoanaerobaculia bacterium]HXK68952.1 50S ribosomal protein L23 [Thermoanaerobaculia bacterium]
MRHPQQIIIRPILTEKSTLLKETSNTMCFEIDRRANKIEVRKAIEVLFNVRVVDVKIVTQRGKLKRWGRFEGKSPNWKKAYVRLAPGQKPIEFFEGV